MQNDRSWISLVGYCLVTVLGTALVFAVIVAGGSVALASHEVSAQAQDSTGTQEQQPAQPPHAELENFSGMITDSYCRARHRRYANMAPTQCAATCIRDGAHVMLVNGDRRYTLTGPNEMLGKLLGARANVTGTLQGDNIDVSSAVPVF
ncbi:MAG TPA: hypothetical protein VJO35_14360 [Terriglobales bacterium]|nr:hypothetical protein [Terriglobales bacterium]